MFFRRNKKKNPSASPPDLKDNEDMDNLQASEARYNDLLSPWEPQIMTTQSLLVWEKPEQSVVLLIVVNVFFW